MVGKEPGQRRVLSAVVKGAADEDHRRASAFPVVGDPRTVGGRHTKCHLVHCFSPFSRCVVVTVGACRPGLSWICEPRRSPQPLPGGPGAATGSPPEGTGWSIFRWNASARLR